VDGNEMHRGLTDRDAMVRLRDVEQAVRERVAVNYKGWEHDRDELVSVVLGKYFTKFGRGPGPDNLHAWLKPVIRNAGVDLDRKAPEDLLVDDDDDLDFVEVLGVVHSGASYVGVKADVWRRAFALICEEQRELLYLTQVLRRYERCGHRDASRDFRRCSAQGCAAGAKGVHCGVGAGARARR